MTLPDPVASLSGGELRFDLPLPPNVLQSRHAHWGVRVKVQKAYYQQCDTRVWLRRAPRPPARPLARAELDAELHVAGTMDRDNLEARLKYSVDWLVTRGYLVDDGPLHLERAGPVRQVRVGPADTRLLLVLTPLLDTLEMPPVPEPPA